MKTLAKPSKLEIEECVDNKENFRIEGIPQKEIVAVVDKIINSKSYSTRIKYRGSSLTMLVPPIAPFSIIYHAAHNLLTSDPDWVIYKHVVSDTIDVKFFKPEVFYQNEDIS